VRFLKFNNYRPLQDWHGFLALPVGFCVRLIVPGLSVAALPPRLGKSFHKRMACPMPVCSHSRSKISAGPIFFACNPTSLLPVRMSIVCSEKRDSERISVSTWCVVLPESSSSGTQPPIRTVCSRYSPRSFGALGALGNARQFISFRSHTFSGSLSGAPGPPTGLSPPVTASVSCLTMPD